MKSAYYPDFNGCIKKTQAVKKTFKTPIGYQDLSIPVINRILDSSLDFVELNRKSEKKLKLLNGKTQINLFLKVQQEH